VIVSLDLVDYERKAREAVQAFWGNREAARQKQIEAGKADQGERAGVTSGKNMDGFIALVLDVVHANGLAHAEIHQKRTVLTLPGYFRPTKLWDLLVIHRGEGLPPLSLKAKSVRRLETISTTGRRRPSVQLTTCGRHTVKMPSGNNRDLS
jgi:hypothetical protein